MVNTLGTHRSVYIVRPAFTFGLGAFLHSLPIQAQQAPATLIFEGATVVDVTDGRLLPQRTVVIVGNRIQTVKPAGKGRAPAGAQVVDARGKYLIPGLWDMHPHLITPGPFVPARQADKDRPYYSTFIAHGVTGIRWMAQRDRSAVDSFFIWQREVAAGTRVGPRVVGPSVDLKDMVDPLPLGTPDDVRRTMNSYKAAGMAFIKYHGGTSPALYFAILREARRVGLPLVGHVPGEVSEVEAADSGHRSIEHASQNHRCSSSLAARRRDSSTVAKACAPAAAAYIRNGTWLTPTIALMYNNEATKGKRESIHRSLFELSSDVVRTLRRLGVKRFLAGTDTGPGNWRGRGVRPGLSLLQEIVLLAEAGLTSLEALQAATLNPAQLLEATDSIGTVAPGKLADLVLLDANPLADIRHVMNTRAVVANGRYFDRSALEAMDSEGMELARVFAKRQPGAVP